MIISKLDLTDALSNWEETFKWYLIKNAGYFFNLYGGSSLRKAAQAPYVKEIQEWYNTYIAWIPVFPPKNAYVGYNSNHGSAGDFEAAFSGLRSQLPGIFNRIQYNPAKSDQALKELNAIVTKYISPWAVYAMKKQQK